MTERSGTGRLALAAGTALALLVADAGAEERLRLHHFLPPQAIAQTEFLEPWANKVMADSGGRIRIEIFPAMQLGGKPSQLFDQVRDGVVDLGWTVPGYTPGRFPTLEVFELPFVGASAEATSQAVMEFSLAHLGGAFAGVRPLVFHTHAPGALHVRGHAIERIEDLAGLKLRTPNRTITATLERLGAIPVGMPAMQVPQAIARGVVDGTVFPWEVTLPLRIHEITDSHTNVFTDRGLYTVVIMLAMNQGRYDDLPADLKAVIDANSGLAVAAWAGRVWDEAELPGMAAAEDRGNRMIDLDAAEVARWQRASEPVIEDWVTRMGEQGSTLLAEARALVAKYAGN